MDRLISEQAIIELIEFFQMNPQHFDFVNLIDDIKKIPSAEQRWIPVGERLPKTNGKVLAVHKSAELGYEVCITTYLGFWFSSDVIAWQPLPKWEEEDESNN